MDWKALLSALAALYITAQRLWYSPRGTLLTAQDKAKFAGFFSPELLDSARLAVLTEERVVNPSVYHAISFFDTIVARGPLTDGLLFHELVHLEQYRQLGIPRFSDLYVRGFLSRGVYAEIPLEQSAYALQARYEKDAARAFLVANEVAASIAAGKFQDATRV